MKGDLLAAAQNLVGAAAQHWNAGRIEALAALFCENGTAEFVYEERTAAGRAAILEMLRAHQAAMQAQGWTDLYFLHSPSWQLHRSRRSAMFSVESHTFYLGEGRMMNGCTRFTAKLRLEAGRWRIASLSAADMESLVPLECPPVCTQTGAPAADADAAVSGADCVQLENLLGRFVRSRRTAKDIWADGATLFLPDLMDAPAPALDAIARLDALEKENGNLFLSVPYYAAPVLSVDGDRARGVWTVQDYGLRGAAFGCDPAQIVTALGFAEAAFVRVGGCWKLASLRHIPVVQLPREPLRPDAPGQVDIASGKLWLYPDEAENIAPQMPYDVFEIRSILTEWTTRARRGESPDFAHTYMTADAALDIRGPQTGEAMMARLQGYADAFAQHYKLPSSHNSSSPYVVISPDGTASGYFLDRSWTTLGQDELDRTHHMRLLGLYRIDLRREQGEWRVTRLQWYPVCSIGDRLLDKKTSRGWCGCDDPAGWPMALETVRSN